MTGTFFRTGFRGTSTGGTVLFLENEKYQYWRYQYFATFPRPQILGTSTEYRYFATFPRPQILGTSTEYRYFPDSEQSKGTSHLSAPIRQLLLCTVVPCTIKLWRGTFGNAPSPSDPSSRYLRQRNDHQLHPITHINACKFKTV